MKVAVIIDTWFPAIGGGQINAWEISRRAVGSDCQIDILTRNNGKDAQSKHKFLKVIKIGRKSKPNNTASKLIFCFNVFFYLIRRNYDLFHVHPFLPAIPVKLAGMVKKKPVIFTVHGTRLFEKTHPPTPSRLLEGFILTKIKYTQVISVTQAFLKIKNVNEHIQVIPNGVNLKEFSQVKVNKAKFPKILWVGRFDPVKKVEDLILATKKLSKEIKNVELHLVGYGYQEVNLKKFAREVKATNVIFKKLPNRADLIKEYKSAHVFALPSASEGFPISLLEARAAGLSAVATNVGGIPEIIKNRNDGILIESGDIEALTNALKFYLKKRNNTAQPISEKYSWNKITSSTKQMYKKYTCK